jgi:hypothetical protein
MRDPIEITVHLPAALPEGEKQRLARHIPSDVYPDPGRGVTVTVSDGEHRRACGVSVVFPEDAGPRAPWDLADIVTRVSERVAAAVDRNARMEAKRTA